MSKTTITTLDRRRHMIKIVASQFKGQPLQPHVLAREVFLRTGIHASDATIKNDIRKIVDALPHTYYLHRGALVRTPTISN